MLACVGVSYKVTPIELRETAAHAVRALAARGRPAGLNGLVPLLTCNRVELYGEIPDESSCDLSSAFPDQLRSHLYTLSEIDAFHHLTRVAAGLESVVLGESQILSQVGTALRSAAAAGNVTPGLRRVFRIALRTAQRARDQLWSMLPPASIGSVAAELARRHLAASTRDGQLALIGAGHVARAVLHELHRTRTSVGRVTILNRSVERARLLAASTPMNVQSLAALPAVLRQAAVVIAATSAPAPIITSADLSAVAAERPSLLIDAGAPRNVDAAVAELPDLTLVTVDSLGERAEELRRAREELVPRVEELVGEVVYGSSVPA